MHRRTLATQALNNANTKANAPAVGSYTITITGTEGSQTHQTTVALNVTAPPDFSVSVNPTSRSVERGDTAKYTVSIAPVNGFTGAVTLSIAGQPPHSTVTCTPNPATGTSTCKVKTQENTPPGTYLFTITGTSGTLSHSTTATLIVTREEDD